MSERLTKKQLKDDQFLDSVQKAIAYAQENVGVVVAGVVGFIVLVVLAVRIGGMAAGVESNVGNPEAQAALAEARNQFALGRLDAGSAALEDIRIRWPKDEVGSEATYILANAYFESADFDRSRQTYEAFLEAPLHDTLLRDGARLGIAACLEESGDLAGATTAYEAIWDDGGTAATRIQGALSAARCLRGQGELERARVHVQRVLDVYPEAPEIEDARFELLRLEGGSAS